MSVESIVQQQVLAYNSRDIKAFIACHHPKVELYNFPSKTPFAVGRDRLVEIYSGVFEKSPQLHTEIVDRIVIGHTVIDSEIVTGRVGTKSLKIVAIYKINDGLIASAHFIRE